MRVPLEINAEWSWLANTDDAATNLASVRVIQSWLDQVVHALEQGLGSASEPKIYGHARSSVEGVTHVDFDGVDSRTLRYWLRWWRDPKRAAAGRQEAGRQPEVEAERIRDELRARGLDV